MKQRDIIVVGIQPWDIQIGSNCKNLALEFSKNHRVMYVNAPLDRINGFKNRNDQMVKNRLDVIRGRKPSLEKIQDNFWVYTPPVVVESVSWLPLPMFRKGNEFNNRKTAKHIKEAASQLGFKDMVLFNDSDMFRSYYLPELLGVDQFIYYTRDNLMTVPYWYKHGHVMEPELMAKADVVVANSPYLAELASKHNPHAYYVGQGCEVGDYLPDNVTETAFNKEDYPGPVIGYVGLLSSRRLDISVLEKLAEARPQWQLMLVGPEEDCFKASVLHEMDNVHFMGPQPPDDLPKWVKGFDVCLNPQAANDLTKGNYPRKIDEYLAMGKPVVATYTPTMEVFKDYVYLANRPEEYVELIERALTENSTQIERNRIAFAAGHTWTANVEAIWDALQRSQESNFKLAA